MPKQQAITTAEVVEMIKEVLDCDQTERIFIDATSYHSKAVAQLSPQLSMKPGSAMLHTLKSTATYLKAVSGIRNLSVLEFSSVFYNYWTNKDGERKLGPNPGYLRFQLFLYGVPEDTVAKLQYTLASKYQDRVGGKMSTIYYPVLISVCAATHTQQAQVMSKKKRVVQGNLNASKRLKVLRESDEHEVLDDDRV